MDDHSGLVVLPGLLILGRSVVLLPLLLATDSSVVKKKTVAGGIYSHWFALALYDLYTSEDVEPTITMEFPSLASVDQIVKSVRSTVSLSESSQMY